MCIFAQKALGRKRAHKGSFKDGECGQGAPSDSSSQTGPGAGLTGASRGGGECLGWDPCRAWWSIWPCSSDKPGKFPWTLPCQGWGKGRQAPHSLAGAVCHAHCVHQALPVKPRPGQQSHRPWYPSVGGSGPWVMAGRGRAQSRAFTLGGLPPGPPGSWRGRCPPSQDGATGGYERLQLDRPLLEPQPLWTAHARAWGGVRIRPQESSSNAPGLGAVWKEEACLSCH